MGTCCSASGRSDHELNYKPVGFEGIIISIIREQIYATKKKRRWKRV